MTSLKPAPPPLGRPMPRPGLLGRVVGTLAKLLLGGKAGKLGGRGRPGA